MNTLPPLVFASALVAFVLLPVDFAIAGSALFAAAMLGIMFSDYSRVRRTARLALVTRSRRPERFPFAA